VTKFPLPTKEKEKKKKKKKKKKKNKMWIIFNFKKKLIWKEYSHLIPLKLKKIIRM
jgi:hypothetical protein